MKVYPVPGRLVRDPVSGIELGADGLGVKDSDAFWLRRLADGDVTDTAVVTNNAPAGKPEKPTAAVADKGNK